MVLENCHLAGDWTRVLAALVAALPGMRPNPRFRLMLSISQSHVFPEAILMRSMKLVLDPPTGIKENVMQVRPSVHSYFSSTNLSVVPAFLPAFCLPACLHSLSACLFVCVHAFCIV